MLLSLSVEKTFLRIYTDFVLYENLYKCKANIWRTFSNSVRFILLVSQSWTESLKVFNENAAFKMH